MDTYAQAQAGTVRQALAVEGPMIAVGKAPDLRPWHSLSHAPLAHVAALRHAAEAEVLNVPGVIAAVPRLRTALAALVAWSARTGHGDSRPWQDARALLDALRDPRAGI